jgi:hypothetical protein
MNEDTSLSIRVVRPDEFSAGTSQTPGSQRLAAISPDLGVSSALWGGTFLVEPGAQTGIHHHWPSGNDRLCTRGQIIRSVGRTRGTFVDGERRRFSACTCVARAPRNQPFAGHAVSLDRRSKHFRTHRSQSPLRHLGLNGARNCIRSARPISGRAGIRFWFIFQR